MSRTRGTLAALAMVALITAGCSNAATPTFTVTATSTSTPTQTFTRTPTVTFTVTNTPAGTGIGSSAGNNTATAAAGTGSSGGGNATNRDQAVKFAECMRKNGVSKFPDPDASGQLTIDAIANGSSVDTNSAAFQQAISACKDLEPAGFTGHKRSAQEQANALKFAQCIRNNGVKDFPDPDPDGPLVDTDRIPSAARNGGMSILNAAMRKCRDLAASAGVTGGQ